MDPCERGNYYFGVKVSADICEEKEIYLHADALNVTPEGALRFVWQRKEGVESSELILAPSKWLCVWAASCVDGCPIAVCHGLGVK